MTSARSTHTAMRLSRHALTALLQAAAALMLLFPSAAWAEDSYIDFESDQWVLVNGEIGEHLIQHVDGTKPIEHLGGIPYSLELIEADLLPYSYNDDRLGIVHGVQKDTWGRPNGFHLWLQPPGNIAAGLIAPGPRNTKRVPAENMIHIKFTRRSRQTRGVTIFHGVINRLDECPGTPPGTPVDRKGCELKGEYTLQGVNFESNSDRLAAGASNVLDQVAETLRKYPELRIEVQGHTDSDGAAEYNESLSSRRAQTVRDYIASKGVDAGRMTVRGYGESQPVADNTTSAGKAQNRRVVLRILED